MKTATRSRLSLGAGTGVAVLVVSVVGTQLSWALATYALYIIGGLLVATLLHQRPREDQISSVSPKQAVKLAVSCAALTLVAAILTNTYLLPIWFGVTAVAAITSLTVIRVDRVKSQTAQITLFLLVSLLPVAVFYLLTGFYFGGGDLLVHTRTIEYLVQSGTMDNIPDSRYQLFQGLHLTAAIPALILAIPAYASVEVLGVLGLGVVIVAAFSTFRELLNRELAIFAGLAIISSPLILEKISYFYPQTLALILLSLVVLSGIKFEQSERWEWFVVSLVLLGMMMVTHHLTFVIAGVVLSLYVLVAVCVQRFGGRVPDRPVVLLISGLIPLAYWTGTESRFLRNILFAVYELIVLNWQYAFSKVTDDGRALQTTFFYGDVTTFGRQQEALLWLATPEAIHYVLLIACLALAVVAIAERVREYRAYLTELVTGLSGAPLILKTPITFKSMNRIALFWSFLFSGVVGVGLRSIVSSVGWRQLAAFFVLTVFIVSGNPVLQNEVRFDEPYSHQNKLSEKEYAEFRSAAGFIERQVSPERISGLWLSRLVFAHFGLDDVTSVTATPEGVRVTTRFVAVQSDGAEYVRNVESPLPSYLGKIYVSEECQTETIAQAGKIYTTGKTIILKPDGLLYGSC